MVGAAQQQTLHYRKAIYVWKMWFESWWKINLTLYLTKQLFMKKNILTFCYMNINYRPKINKIFTKYLNLMKLRNKSTAQHHSNHVVLFFPYLYTFYFVHYKKNQLVLLLFLFFFLIVFFFFNFFIFNISNIHEPRSFLYLFSFLLAMHYKN